MKLENLYQKIENVFSPLELEILKHPNEKLCEIAARMATTETTLQVTKHRLRKKIIRFLNGTQYLVGLGYMTNHGFDQFKIDFTDVFHQLFPD